MDLDDVKVNNLVDHINDENLRDIIKNILIKENCMQTLKKPASSTGKYHPSFSNKNWGLLMHTLLVVKAANRICELYLAIKKINNLDRDIIISACILHDCFKYKDPSGKDMKFVHNDHGYSGFNIINKYFDKLDDDNKHKGIVGYKISKAVRYHMSNWCGRKDDIKFVHNNNDVICEVVQIADMIASDKKLMEYVRKCYEY